MSAMYQRIYKSSKKKISYLHAQICHVSFKKDIKSGIKKKKYTPLASKLIKWSSLLLMIKAAFKIAGATSAEVYLGLLNTLYKIIIVIAKPPYRSR